MCTHTRAALLSTGVSACHSMRSDVVHGKQNTVYLKPELPHSRGLGYKEAIGRAGHHMQLLHPYIRSSKSHSRYSVRTSCVCKHAEIIVCDCVCVCTHRPAQVLPVEVQVRQLCHDGGGGRRAQGSKAPCAQHFCHDAHQGVTQLVRCAEGCEKALQVMRSQPGCTQDPDQEGRWMWEAHAQVEGRAAPQFRVGCTHASQPHTPCVRALHSKPHSSRACICALSCIWPHHMTSGPQCFCMCTHLGTCGPSSAMTISIRELARVPTCCCTWSR